MSDIFISYASEDRPWAEKLADALIQHGWSVWWDRHIPVGKTFAQVIQEQLHAAKCVVALWSKAAGQSEWVLNEAEEGRQRGILVPALIDESSIPFEFRRIQAARLVDWHEAPNTPEFQKFLEAIRQTIEKQGSTEGQEHHGVLEHEREQKEKHPQRLGKGRFFDLLWVRSIFAITLLCVLISFFVALVFHPNLRTSEATKRSSSDNTPMVIQEQKVTPELVAKIVSQGESLEEDRLVERYKKGDSVDRAIISDKLIEMISSMNDREVDSGVTFLVGHLWFHELQENDALRVATALASASLNPNPKVRKSIASVFQMSLPPATIPVVFGFMKQLAKDKEEQVRVAALRNIGELKYRAPDYIQDEIWEILIPAWKTKVSTKVREAALFSLKNFAYSDESEGRQREISAIVLEALNTHDPQLVHGALWVMGGLTFGFKPVSEYNDRILAQLLVVYKSNRSIPRSWYLQAFENVSGELPPWAQEQLARDKQEERSERQERLQMELYSEERRKKQPEQ